MIKMGILNEKEWIFMYCEVEVEDFHWPDR